MEQVPTWLAAAVTAAGLTTVYNAEDWDRNAGAQDKAADDVTPAELAALRKEIAALRAAVDTFFTDVFVMADDPRLRTARLTLMAGLRDLILDLADISEIVPQTE